MEEKPKRHGGSTGASAPRSTPSKAPRSEVRLAHVGGAVPLATPTVRRPAGADAAQQHPGDRVGDRAPGRRRGDPVGHQAEQPAERGPRARPPSRLSDGERNASTPSDTSTAHGSRRTSSKTYVAVMKSRACAVGASSTRCPAAVSTIASAKGAQRRAPPVADHHAGAALAADAGDLAVEAGAGGGHAPSLSDGRSPGGDVAGHGGGGRDVEGVDAGRHRDHRAPVGRRLPPR